MPRFIQLNIEEENEGNFFNQGRNGGFNNACDYNNDLSLFRIINGLYNFCNF